MGDPGTKTKTRKTGTPPVKGCKLLTGNAHPELAAKLAEQLGFPLCDAQVGEFADGEVRVQIDENIRGLDVFVFQPTFPPASNVIELLVMLDAVRRASARRVTAVVPYFGYARQDRKDQPRVPITAKLMANLITAAGADRMLTMDLHSPQVQGFFDIPFDHLYAAPVLIEYFQKKAIPNLAIVAPDMIAALLGPAWSDAALVLQILCLGRAILQTTYFFGIAIMAVGRADLSLKLQVGSFVLRIFVVFYAVQYGLVAVTLADLVVTVLIYPAWVLATRRLIGLDFWHFIRLFRPALVATIAMALVVLATGKWLLGDAGAELRLLTLIPIGIAVYGGALFMTGRQSLDQALKAFRGSR